MPFAARAQAQATVSGVIRDAATHAPLKGATVALRNPADSAERPLGAVTGADGAFSIKGVAPGRKYRLEATYVGYQKLAREVAVDAGRATLSLGDVEMTASAVDLEGVQVTSQRDRVQVMADKTVYGVENNPAYTATNVSDLLAQIPSVSVDQDGKVSLRGSDNVTIMMNDRPLTMPADQLYKFLQSLPASTVKDIEIRTNPGAQFDAKFQGGIINIVTRRTSGDTFGGNITAGGDSRPSGTGGAGLYYNGDDINASIGGGVYFGKNDGTGISQRVDYRNTLEQREEGVGTSNSTSGSDYGYGQVDYRFSENDLASLSFNLNYWSSDYISSGNHTFYNADGGVVGRFFDTSGPGSDQGNAGNYNSASLLLRHSFAKDHTLRLDVSYNANIYDADFYYASRYFRANGEMDSIRSAERVSSYKQDKSTVITTLDYTNPLSDALTLSIGGKSEINMLDNNTEVDFRDHGSGAYIRDTIQSDHYLPHNTVYAGYANAAYKIAEPLSLQAGLRFERANISAKYVSGVEFVSRSYSNFFPSGSLSYAINDQHNVTLSYRRSIALPDVEALNPTVVKWNDVFERGGNPDLQPEFTHTFDLNYSTFWGMGEMVSIAPYYSTTSGSIENSEQLINGVNRQTTANFNGTYSIGSEMTVGLRPLPWLNLRLSGNVYRKVNRGGPTPSDLHSEATGVSGNGMLNADIMTGLTLGMNLSFDRPPTVGATQQGGYTFWSFSLRQRLLDNKLSISLRVNDPFKLQKWTSIYDSPEFHTESTNRWTSQFVGLTLNYTFGTTPRMEQHKQEKTDTKGGGGAGGAGGGGGTGG